MRLLCPLDICHLDLVGGLPASMGSSERGGLYVVLWWGPTPVGHLRIPSDQLPISASALATLAAEAVAPAVVAALAGEKPLSGDAHLWQTLPALDQPFEPRLSVCEPQPQTRISVVVCTRDRPESLRRCLQSLAGCSPPPAEIIVVDNASQEQSTRETVASFPQVTYVAEPRVGLDVARNTGVRHSTGEIVVFTDDDVCVHSNWIAALQLAFSDPLVMGVTGPALAAALDTPAQCLFEKLWGFNRGYKRITYDGDYFRRHRRIGVPAWEIGAGANMAFRRTVFETLGGFDERLDVGAAGCSGDSEYWHRMLAAEMCCRYDPSVVVFHHHRESMPALKQQMYRNMRGHTAALLVQFCRPGRWRDRHWGELFRLSILLPGHYLKQFVRRVLLGPHPRFATIGAEILGSLAGVAYYLRCVTVDRRKWQAAPPIPARREVHASLPPEDQHAGNQPVQNPPVGGAPLGLENSECAEPR